MREALPTSESLLIVGETDFRDQHRPWGLYRDDPPPVVQASDPDEIVAAVEKLRADPARLGELSRRSREWAVRNHGYARHLQTLESTYFKASVGPPVRA